MTNFQVAGSELGTPTIDPELRPVRVALERFAPVRVAPATLAEVRSAEESAALVRLAFGPTR